VGMGLISNTVSLFSVEQLVCGAEDQDDTWQQVAGVFLPISS